VDIVSFVITPLLGAVIGYSTNWLAIRMLFRPRCEKRVFGVRVPLTPGLIPRERFRISAKIGETLTENVLTGEAFASYLSSSEMSDRIDSFVGGAVDGVLAGRITAGLPDLSGYARSFLEGNPEVEDGLRALVKKVVEENAGRFIGIFINYEKIYESIKKSVLEYASGDGRLTELLSRVTSENAEGIKRSAKSLAKTVVVSSGANLLRSLDLGKLAENQINAFEAEEAERIIISVAGRELRAITMLGGVLGFVIGLAPAVVSLFE